MSVETAYLAGFFDGDGSVGRYASGLGGYPSDRMCVRAVDPVAPGMYERVFGVGRLGEARTPAGRPYYRWAAYGVEARHVLEVMGPYLRVRRVKARALCSFGSACLTPEEGMAYLAGLFDAEGCASSIRPRRAMAWIPHVSVGMTDRVGPVGFADQFGGSVRIVLQQRPWKDVYVWSRRCSEATTALKALLPYLVLKRVAASSLLAWQPISQARTWRERRRA